MEAGFLLKDTPPRQIVDAIHRVAEHHPPPHGPGGLNNRTQIALLAHDAERG